MERRKHGRRRLGGPGPSPLKIDDAKLGESLRQLLRAIAAADIPALKTARARRAETALEIWTRAKNRKTRLSAGWRPQRKDISQ